MTVTKKEKLSYKERQIIADRKLKTFISKRVNNMNKNPIEVITFVNPNGIKTVQKVNNKFITGKSNSKIKQDIFALSKDMKAKYLIL